METTWGGRGTKIAFVVLVVIVVVVAATAYFSYTNPGVPPVINSSSGSSASASTILTTTSSSSQSSSRTTTSNITSTQCTFSGESIGVWLRTVSDSSGAPIAGVNFTAANIENQCGGSTTAATTNSSGWIIFPSQLGAYNLTMTYDGRHYPPMFFPMYPVTETLVTVSLPSGHFSVDVRTYGQSNDFSGPSATDSFGNLSLKMTLANPTVKQGQNLPIRVEFIGPGAWNASYLIQSLRITNASGMVVFNMTERIPSLSPMPYTDSLQDFVFSNGWNANYYPQPVGVPIPTGQYQVTISVQVGGHLFAATQTVQVVP